MKALYFNGSLEIKEVPVPVPKEDEVLIKVHRSSICNTDLEITRGYMEFSGIPGHEFVGRVQTRGSRYYGRLVVGEINCSCGICYLCITGRKTHCPTRTVLGISGHDGVFAEFTVLPERNLRPIPETLAPETAVFTEPLAAAIEIFEQVQIKPSQSVFIFGAGKLGLLISMIFRVNGCEASTFDPNPAKVELARSMGINAYPLSELGDDEQAEICVECTGTSGGINQSLAHLYPRGKLVLKTTVASPKPIDLNRVVINEYEIIGSRCGLFDPALSLLSQGLIDPSPMISRVFEFEDIIEAFGYAAQPGTLKVMIRH